MISDEWFEQNRGQTRPSVSPRIPVYNETVQIVLSARRDINGVVYASVSASQTDLPNTQRDPNHQYEHRLWEVNEHRLKYITRQDLQQWMENAALPATFIVIVPEVLNWFDALRALYGFDS